LWPGKNSESSSLPSLPKRSGGWKVSKRGSLSFSRLAIALAIVLFIVLPQQMPVFDCAKRTAICRLSIKEENFDLSA
jgi:hypothetical protein